MHLKALTLKNFRNYSEETFYFSPGINVISGANAQGKTNLLEAIHFLTTGRSFRTHHLSDLVRFGASAFYLEALFEKNGIEQLLKIYADGETRKILFNATPIPSLRALLGILIGVLLSPEDTQLIKGHPATRRQFLDMQIAQTSPLYLHHLSRYAHAMKHRNHLLRQKKTETIEIWEEEMATSAAYITAARRRSLQELTEMSLPFHETLTPHPIPLELQYTSSAPHSALPSDFRAHYQKYRKRELDQGNTLFGPHRDDVAIHLQKREARYFASEGEQRSCIASLRLAEWTRLKKLSEESPMMSIDDVGISLDPYREEHLYALLQKLGQVFLTTPRQNLPLPTDTHQIIIENGSSI